MMRLIDRPQLNWPLSRSSALNIEAASLADRAADGLYHIRRSNFRIEHTHSVPSRAVEPAFARNFSELFGVLSQNPGGVLRLCCGMPNRSE